MIWSELTQNENFITDMGPGQIYQDKKTSKKQHLARYAVWIPTKDPEKHAIAEVSDDLNYLRKKYKIKTDDIFQLF